jgi:hypothetical protein
MLGGRVIGLARSRHSTLVHVEAPDGATVTARVREPPCDDDIALGDTLWWEGSFAFWTPHSYDAGGRPGIDYDVRIPRLRD